MTRARFQLLAGPALLLALLAGCKDKVREVGLDERCVGSEANGGVELICAQGLRCVIEFDDSEA